MALDLVKQQSKYWVVVRDFEGQVYSPVTKFLKVWAGKRAPREGQIVVIPSSWSLDWDGLVQ